MKHTSKKILRAIVITNQKQFWIFKSTNNVLHTQTAVLLIGQLPFPDNSCTDINYSQTDKTSPRNYITFERFKTETKIQDLLKIY